MPVKVMPVLLLHNRYQQAGGEDEVFAAEGSLLEANGHQVYRYSLHNDQVSDMSRHDLAIATIWNKAVYRELRTLIRAERPQVAHFHNTFPLISPAAYYAARAEGIPVVQTLHNYRLVCPDALLFRDGHVCEDCLGKPVPWPGVFHACYRGSRLATGAVATMLAAHRTLGTWSRAVDTYIALTEFARKKFIQGGLPADKVVTKPNFLHRDVGVGRGQGGYMLFVGRLSREKGIDTLLGAWEQLGQKVPLKVVGDGPLAPQVAEAAQKSKVIHWLGRQTKDQVLDLMKEAEALLFPSVWYEGFPMVIVEAYAAGLPVIASNLGSLCSLVDGGRTGLHFRPGDQEDFAKRVEWVRTHKTELARMREGARAEFEAKYTARRNYRSLMEIYREVAGSQ